ncbi:MAG: hypothetical protein U0800_04545 [Isosphaeraceae bacterium]
MARKLAGLTLAMFLTLAAALLADTPQVGNLSASGVQRGVASNLTINGANLKGHARLLAPFGLTAEYDEADAANLKVKLTAAPETPVGFYPIRVRTDDGLSNPILLAVGQVPEVAEAEDNNTFDKAQAVPSPCAVEGSCTGNDVDYFKFPGKKGQSIVIDAQCARLGSGMDPQIRLTTAARKFIASSDDYPGLLTDARLFAELPEDTDYVVEISDSKYAGANRPVYRLLIGPIPVAGEVFPAGGPRGVVFAAQLRGGNLPVAATLTTQVNPTSGVDAAFPKLAGRIFQVPGSDPALDVEVPAALVAGDLPEVNEPAEPAPGSPQKESPILVAAPILINGRIDPANDVDRYLIAVSPGQKLRLTLRAAEIGSSLDAHLQVLGANNAVIATADDTPLNSYPNVRKKAAVKKADFVSPDASLELTVPQGVSEITAVVRDMEGRGGLGFGYRLTIVPSTPSFELWMDDSEVNIAKGSSTNVYITAERAGYNGPIALAVPNPPPGLSVRAGSIPEGQTIGLLTLSAAPDAAFDVVDLKIRGEGKAGETPIVRDARKALVFAQQLGLPTNVGIQTTLPLATTGPSPIAVEASADPVEIAPGGEAWVPIKVKRGEGADAGLALAPLTALPKGVALAEAKVADKADEGKAAFKADSDAPIGPLTVGFEAKGKVAGKDRTYDVPMVTLNIVRPIVVELASADAGVKPGETVELKGKMARKGGFKDPVTIKLDGLPKGVKADPVTLEGDAAEFTLKIVAEADAPEAQADAKVAPAFQVSKKDYAMPPIPFKIRVEKKAEGQ